MYRAEINPPPPPEIDPLIAPEPEPFKGVEKAKEEGKVVNKIVPNRKTT